MMVQHSFSVFIIFIILEYTLLCTEGYLLKRDLLKQNCLLSKAGAPIFVLVSSTFYAECSGYACWSYRSLK